MQEYFKELFSAKGRYGRMEYLIENLKVTILIIISMAIILSFGWVTWMTSIWTDIPFIIATLMLCAVYYWIRINIAIKRFHDFDVSGWMSLMLVIPILSTLTWLFLLFKKWTEGNNKYWSNETEWDKNDSFGRIMVIFLLILLLLASWYAVILSINSVKKTTQENSQLSMSGSLPTPVDRTVKDGDTVAVDYLGKLEDGTVFDTSIKSEAEKTPKFNPNRDYSPLLFTVGAGQMIKGFDKGVLGMKVGEKKTLRIPPEEAYGTGGTEEVVPKKAFDDKFTETVSRDKYQDVVDIEVPETTFTEQGRPVPKTGETITAGGVSAKVTKVADGKVSLQVENRQNPFYGTKLAVGLEADFEGNKVKITKLTEKDVTVEVTNLVSPFYGKKLEIGLSAMYGGERFTVTKIDKDTVTLERAHELSGKTLVFEVELKEIK